MKLYPGYSMDADEIDVFDSTAEFLIPEHPLGCDAAETLISCLRPTARCSIDVPSPLGIYCNSL